MVDTIRRLLLLTGLCEMAKTALTRKSTVDSDAPLCKTCPYWDPVERDLSKSLGYSDRFDWGRCAYNPVSRQGFGYSKSIEWCRVHPDRQKKEAEG